MVCPDVLSHAILQEVFSLVFAFQYPCFECDGEIPDVLKKTMAALEQVGLSKVVTCSEA